MSTLPRKEAQWQKPSIRSRVIKRDQCSRVRKPIRRRAEGTQSNKVNVANGNDDPYDGSESELESDLDSDLNGDSTLTL